MKYAATFSEMATIFTTISKAEAKVNAMTEADNAYSKFSEDHLRAFGYDFTSEQIEEQCNLYDAKRKAEREAKKALKGCMEILELDSNEYFDSLLIEKIQYAYKYIDLLYSFKQRAMELTRSIDIYV